MLDPFSFSTRSIFNVPIQLLSKELRSQIAAGEVVERPASVVKELVENALDAGADHIQIRILDAGKSLIQVTDNGAGILEDEIELAVTRHATSKLSTVKDLSNIRSLGFRGEALAAIASVSRFHLVSRNNENEKGTDISVEAGKLQGKSRLGAPVGTQVRVEDLFFNVPARRKFQKSGRSELGRIFDLISRYALIRPDVRFSLEVENKTRLQTSGKGDHREVLAEIFTPNIANRMIALDVKDEKLQLGGFLGPLDVTRSNRAGINLFVNGRWIRDIALTSAILQAYRGMLMVGRFPIATIFIDLPPDQIDVNVHPTKAEIRFLDGENIFRSVSRGIKRALMAHTPVSRIDPSLRWQANIEPILKQEKGLKQSELHLDPTNVPTEQKTQLDLPNVSNPLLRLVGQVGQTYIVAEAPDGIYLVDQHAAHERVLYEKFQSQRATMESQILLEAVQVEVNAKETELLNEQLELLNDISFSVESFGPQQFIIRAIPVLLIGSDPESALRVIIEDFEEDEGLLEKEKDAKLIARICKSASIKAGQSLSIEEQEGLLTDLEACESPRTCPHGRPTMIHLSVDLLEKQFGRKGAR